MSNLSDRVPQAGLEFLLSRVLTPRITVDDVMWYVRGIYGLRAVNDPEWVVVRDRIARTLTRLRAGTGSRGESIPFRAL